MRRLLISLVCLLSACAPELTPMSKDEAENVLERFARGRAPTSPCTDEGRRLLRSAAHSYAGALYAKGRVWPDVEAFYQLRAYRLNETDLYIVGAAMAGVIKPDDLGRPGRYLSHFVRAAVIYEPNGLGTEQQLNLACEEVLAFHQAGVRNTADLQRQFQALQRAREQHDPRRVRQLSERYDRHHNRAYAEMQTLAAALRAKLSNVAGLSHGNNP